MPRERPAATVQLLFWEPLCKEGHLQRGSWSCAWHEWDSSTSKTLPFTPAKDIPASKATQDVAPIIQALAADLILKWRKLYTIATEVQLDKIQETSEATIYSAKSWNGLTKVPQEAWSPFFIMALIPAVRLKQISVSSSAQFCKHLHKLEHPPENRLHSSASRAWCILDSPGKTLFLPNPNAGYEKEQPSTSAHSYAICYEDRIQLLTRQEGCPTAELPEHTHWVILLPDTPYAVSKVATRNKNPSVQLPLITVN